MTYSQHVIVYGIVGLFAAATIVYLAAVSALLSRLKQRHPATFRELGEPSLFSNNTVSNGARVVRFLLAKDYENLHDPHVSRIASACRALLIVIPISLVCVFAIALLYASIGRP